jgi:hypothetical protein
MFKKEVFLIGYNIFIRHKNKVDFSRNIIQMKVEEEVSRSKV